jgi:DNA (cytosine-5)-methyltransferase 1
MKKIVDLFAGCGGLSLGFQDAGFEIVGAFEYWDVAASCYSHNFKHPIFRDDLSDVDNAIGKIKGMKPDIIIGGPPCQDFSHAGKRIEAGRASLTSAFAEIVAGIMPRYFVMENVDRAQKSNAYSDAKKILSEAGYGLNEMVLDASLCGVPQKRKRFFCIGSLGKEDGFLLSFIQDALDEKEMTLRDYFGDTLDLDCYYRHPRNYSRRAVFSIDEPAPTIRGVNRPVPQGYPGHPNDACEVHAGLRPLTTLERALVQTFPSSYKWEGSKTNMEQMIGNAVPVKLAEFVAKALLHHIIECEETVLDYQAFSDWLAYSQELSDRTKRDIVSRLKRADSICAIKGQPDAYYLFQLEQSQAYKKLTTAVRSQMKRAITLFSEFLSGDELLAEAM